MSDWQLLIPKCFSEQELMFAHTADERAAAWALRAELAESDVSPALLESAIEDWLHTQTSNTGQLFEQMARVRAFFDT